jgi:hypothetical protein
VQGANTPKLTIGTDLGGGALECPLRRRSDSMGVLCLQNEKEGNKEEIETRRAEKVNQMFLLSVSFLGAEDCIEVWYYALFKYS